MLHNSDEHVYQQKGQQPAEASSFEQMASIWSRFAESFWFFVVVLSSFTHEDFEADRRRKENPNGPW